MAETTFKVMRSCGLEPNVVTYTILIGCFCKEGKLLKACSFFDLMLLNKCEPNDVTFNYLINGLTYSTEIATSDKRRYSQQNGNSLVLEFFGMMISDGWDQRAAAYNSILICLCLHKMVKTALRLRDKMTNKGFSPDPVSFAALLHGLCREGRLHEWRNVIPCNLNEQELQIGVKYSGKLDEFLFQGLTSEASHILHTLVEQLNLKEVHNLKVSSR